MRAFVSFTALLCVALTCSATEAPDDPSAAYVPAPARLTSLEDWDEASARLYKVIWNVHSGSRYFGEDAAGLSLASAVDRYILAPDVEASLRALHQRSQRSGQGPPSDALTDASRILQSQTYRIIVLWQHWYLQPAFSLHRQALAAVMQRVPETERAASRAQTEAADIELSRAVIAALDMQDDATRLTQLHDLWQRHLKIFDAYNSERGRLAKIAGPLTGPGGTAPSRKAAGPCKRSSRSTSGGARPKAEGPPASDLYPAWMPSNYFEGNVVVTMDVDANGCLVASHVTTSSGLPDLDEAGLDWADRARFMPAEKDGHATDGSLSLRIRFQLRGGAGDR